MCAFKIVKKKKKKKLENEKKIPNDSHRNLWSESCRVESQLSHPWREPSLGLTRIMRTESYERE